MEVTGRFGARPRRGAAPEGPVERAGTRHDTLRGGTGRPLDTGRPLRLPTAGRAEPAWKATCMDSTATGSVQRLPAAQSPAGLTSAEAQERRRRGEGNVAVAGGSRSYARILRTNVFNFYNTILFVIGAALLALGRYNDAFVSVGLGLVNAALSAVQEIRAKRKLDHLQLLNQGVVHVLRDG